ncbi:Zn-ribbon domain-containing OB-fold protein [Rhodococcus sp. NPDC057014]|uniref:Zn-ribbon domain-containing OB-fold protein n=1 Tax=Rhodococcus sp. NPDC057014 TaxID=3346000 RepID=UPI003634381D
MSELLSTWTDGLIRGIPRVPRCEKCGLWNWYPQPSCRSCQVSEFTWHDIGAEGVVHTWTEVMRAIDSVDGLEPPYVVALVEPVRTPGVRIPMRARRGIGIGDRVAFEPISTPLGPVLEISSTGLLT